MKNLGVFYKAKQVIICKNKECSHIYRLGGLYANHHFFVQWGCIVFLFGMKVIRGIRGVSGKRLEIILGKMTDTKIKAILAGTLITCLIQSSTAMTILLIGFVNAKVMKLKRQYRYYGCEIFGTRQLLEL